MLPHDVLKPLGFTFGMAVGTTVVSLPSIPTGAIRAKIQVETQPIRACFDGNTTSVTAGTGYYMDLVTNQVEYVIEGYDNLARMNMRCNGSTAGTINVLYEGIGQLP